MRSSRRVASGIHPALFHISEAPLYTMSIVVFEAPMLEMLQDFLTKELVLDISSPEDPKSSSGKKEFLIS
jgi:hypothetical protein